MALSGWDRETSPYHAGEAELHARLDRKERQETLGRRIHRPAMPDEHRAFFRQLPYFIAGSVDAQGWPWASILFGEPGFVSTPTDRTLRLHGSGIPGDPIRENLAIGAPMGFLGIEMATRRRNRVNGVVSACDSAAFSVDVVQSYGNCPKYIHTRDTRFLRDPSEGIAPEIERFTALDDAARGVIEGADAFFVASHNARDDKHDTGGTDVNYRGGKPGFVRVDGNTLTIPDFVGNFAFNTLGNFVVTPRAGLLFIDFETGDLWQMTGTVGLFWEKTEGFEGAERTWAFHLEHGHRLKDAVPVEWAFGEASPNILRTGAWRNAEG